ncbi:GntR family transcriptional regulator [Criibacterium bergeronii]|uniref:GntR family transcriptional regulator n=1 Tax=Criibacterium bergeronii TaxID=1871336 RepID=A0A371INU1_9FIRM|nr:GntR family transcriptional regulator [Criibacterium bergeronii]MBS6062408.1 GntR family transcriptional regulator [Peptostreptococcaceae bacterium]RDY22158.1 GntR family transcriptional regulator [Criibacterium bergeronii]
MIEIDVRSRVPIYEQIINSVKHLSLNGVLRADEKLPSVRELSQQMTINPNTVQKAYQELERQGIIYVKRGQGSFINPTIKAINKEVSMEKIREMLKQVVLECMYLDIDKDELVKIVSETYDKGQQVPNSQTKEENI